MITKSKKRKLEKGGFSLIEITIAMVVFVVLVLGTAGMLYMTGGSIVKQGHRRAAMTLANNAMEVARKTNFSTLSNSTDTFVDDGISYTVDTTVTTLTTPSLRREIIVSVKYSGEEVTATSLIIEGLGIN